VKVQFVQTADGGTIAQIHTELFLQVAMHLDAGPVNHSGLGGILRHRHQQITRALQLHFARTMAGLAGAQRVNPAPIEQFNPEPHHAVGAGAQFANLSAGVAQQERAHGQETNLTTAIGSSFHRHPEFLWRGVLPIGIHFERSQRSSTLKISQTVPEVLQLFQNVALAIGLTQERITKPLKNATHPAMENQIPQ